MRRRVIALVLLVVSTLLGAVPASADEPAPAPAPRVEIWRGGLPAGFGLRSEACGQRPERGGDPQPEYFTDGLLVRASPSGATELARSVSSLGALTSYRITYSTGLYFWRVRVRVAIPGAGLVGSGFLPGAGFVHQGRVDIMTEPALRWTDATGAEVGLATVTDFLAVRPAIAARPATVGLGADVCDPDVSTAVTIDDITVTTGDSTTIYDFEEPRSPTADRYEDHVTYGGTVTLRTRLTASTESNLAGAPVELWAMNAATLENRRVATVRTAADGTAAAIVRPESTTSYRWRYGHALDQPYAWSERVTRVSVGGDISLRVRRIARNRYVAVVRVSPARGQRVVVRGAVRDDDVYLDRRFGMKRVPASGVVRIRFTAPHHRWHPRARWLVSATVGTAGYRPGGYVESIKIPSRR